VPKNFSFENELASLKEHKKLTRNPCFATFEQILLIFQGKLVLTMSKIMDFGTFFLMKFLIIKN
jgi:hypothetical protein